MHTAPEPFTLDFPGTDSRLGRKMQLDSRSLPYMVSEADPRTLRTVTWPRRIPILDQGDVGACVLYSMVGALGSAPLAFFEDMVSLLPNVEEAGFLALYLYEQTSGIDPFAGQWFRDGSGQDTGTDGLSAAKVLKRRGMVSSYRHARSLVGLLTLLQDGPVCMGMPWYDTFFEPDEDGHIDPRGWADGQVVGGHEVLVMGAEVDRDHLERSTMIVANSWGQGWGQDGYFKMTGQTYLELRDRVDLIQLRS